MIICKFCTWPQVILAKYVSNLQEKMNSITLVEDFQRIMSARTALCSLDSYKLLI